MGDYLPGNIQFCQGIRSILERRYLDHSA